MKKKIKVTRTGGAGNERPEPERNINIRPRQVETGRWMNIRPMLVQPEKREEFHPEPEKTENFCPEPVAAEPEKTENFRPEPVAAEPVKERTDRKPRSMRQMIVPLIFLALIAAFTAYVNRNIIIKALYMDDLYMWSCYGEQNFFEFVFPIGTSARFRPVYWLAAWLQMLIIGNHVNWFVGFNIIINTLVSWFIYYFSWRVSHSRLSALGAALCYSASRFAYYQIGQALGLMETLATGLALIMLMFLYRYMFSPRENEERRGRRLWIRVLVVWFLLVFVHERYMGLLPLCYYVLLVRLLYQEKGTRKQYLKGHRVEWLLPLAALALVVGIRFLAIGRAIPAGTGGTQVTETFSLSDTLSHAVSQIWYLLGVNPGPEYLSGVHWENTPLVLKAMVKTGVMLTAVIGVMYLIALVLMAAGSRQEKKRFAGCIAESLLFGGFIALCIGASSVTIRVEMRWIYVSFAAMLIWMTAMVRSISGEFRFLCRIREKAAAENASAPDTEPGTGTRRPGTKQVASRNAGGGFAAAMTAVFLLFAGVSVYTNIQYRTYFPNIYFWQNQTRMNSLAEQTIEKYGREAIFGNPVYIIGNTYGMTEFYAETFFKPFDRNKTAGGTRIYLIEDPADIPDYDYYPCYLLRESPETGGYEDLTEEKSRFRT